MAIYVARTSHDMECRALTPVTRFMAQRWLRDGASLTEASHRLGMCSRCLDVALWRSIGDKS